MNRQSLPPVIRKWKVAAVVVGAAALMASSGLAAPSDAATALVFHTTAPTVRVLDTRNGTGAPTAPIGAGGYLGVTIPGLPDDAAAVTLNVTVLGGTTGSHLKVWAAGDPEATTSVLAWNSAITMSTTAVVPVHSDHVVVFFNKNGNVNVIADLVGYFVPGGSGNGATGAAGAQGPAGVAGATGPQGPAGANGTNGANGANGADGAEGMVGIEGPKGDKGDTGAPGVSPGSVYRYAVNTGTETVQRNPLANHFVTFSNTGAAINGTVDQFIVPNATTAGMFDVSAAGIYRVTYWLLAAEPSQIDVMVNNAQPTPALTFGAAAGLANTGTALVSVTAGGSISLQNRTSTGGATDDSTHKPGDLNLSTTAGGTASPINAWILIERVANIP